MAHRTSNCIVIELLILQLLQSVDNDLRRYEQKVTVIGTSEDDDRTREDLIEIRTEIKNKLTTVSNDISQQQKS